MSIEANKQLVLDFFEEVMNQRNTVAIPKYFVTGTFLAGGLENLVHGMSTSFPDYHIAAEEVIAENNKVVVRTTMRSTHTGEFFEHLPTGKPIQIGGIHIYTIKDGRIVSYVRESDRLLIYQQLGITPVIETT
jgi:predicted ester cyclase